MHVDIEAPRGEAAERADLVLLHGGIGTGRYHWSKQISGLTEAGFRVHLPDLPGHGHTPVGDQPYTTEVLVDAVRSYLDTFDTPSIVAGFSMGGHTAMGVTATDPQLVAGLVLIGVSICDHAGLDRWRKKFDPDTLEQTYPLWARQLSKLHTPLGGPDAWREVCRRDSTRLSAAVDTEALAALEVPTLLVRGDSDETVDPGHFTRLREIWPHAEEFVVPAGGHDVQLTRSRVTGPVLRDFLARSFGDGR